jgi:cytochrome c-type biogenesis protein CcmE
MQGSTAQPAVGEKSGFRHASKGRLKFIIGGIAILAAVLYLIISQTKAGAEYFLTVRELQNAQSQWVGKSVRVSGVVIGDTIAYNSNTLALTFTVANIPGSNQEIEAQGGLASVLHAAAADPSLPRMKVVYHGPRPDLLKNEAQAIMTGKLQPDGTFQADELLLKCPTKYEDAVPAQVKNQ